MEKLCSHYICSHVMLLCIGFIIFCLLLTSYSDVSSEGSEAEKYNYHHH